MKITEGAEEAIEASHGTVDSLVDWFWANQTDLPIGLAVAAAIVAFMMVLRGIGAMMAGGDPNCLSWRGVFGRMLSKTKISFMVATALNIVVTYAEVPERLGQIVDFFFIITFAFQGAIWARELILGLIGRRAAEGEGETLSNAMSVIRVLVSVALFAIAIIVILDNLGVNVTALIAGFGIGGIAIGLAAQGIFSDLFAALSIIFDRPFRRGDTIRYDPQSVATVEKIGLKSTRMRSITGEVRVMSNTKLLEREIYNYAGGTSRISFLVFGVVYQTSPNVIEQIPEIARSVVTSRSGCSLVRCEVTGFGASSIDFEFIFESATTEIGLVAADRTKIVADLMRMFAMHGIEFAYPTQTTFTAAPDGRMVMPYAQVQPVVAVEGGENLDGKD